jgi:DNA-binding transcriptional LysR family regulator
LRYFAAVADAGTFTHAAALLFIAQPTLSQQIQRLEQIVGTPLLHRRRGGVRLTAAGTKLLEATRDVLSAVDHAVSQTRQTAGLGRPQLRFVIPADLPDSLAVRATCRLRSAAEAAEVAITWLETALDAEFSPIRQRRADAGLGWLTASPDALPAPLEPMSLGEFEPDVWIPHAHPAARREVIGLDELASMDVIHGPRRASPAIYDRWLEVLRAVNPAVRVHRPAAAALPADGTGLRRDRRPAHRGADRPHRHRRTPARRDPAPPPGGHRQHDPRQHSQPPAGRHCRPGVERRPAPPAPANPVRHRRRRDAAGVLAACGGLAGAASRRRTDQRSDSRPRGQLELAQPGHIPPQSVAALSRPISLPYLR